MAKKAFEKMTEELNSASQDLDASHHYFAQVKRDSTPP